MKLDVSDCLDLTDDTISVENGGGEKEKTKSCLENIESLYNKEIEKSKVCEVKVLRKSPRDEVEVEVGKDVTRDPLKQVKSPKDVSNKKSKCLLCDMEFVDFRKLLWHITNKHFKPEINNIITEKYSGFWRSEKMKEDKEHVCQDCGHRMRTRGQLQNHLGVEHNLLWDIYLKKVQSSKKSVKPPTDSFPEQTRSLKKKKDKKNKQNQNFEKTSQQPSIEGKGTSFYKDSKLLLIRDENPYSKKFIFGNKTKNILKSEPSVDTSDKISLLETIATNVGSSLHEPYCSICQILLEPASRAKLSETQTRSLEKVPDQSSVWIPTIETPSSQSRVIIIQKQ